MVRRVVRLRGRRELNGERTCKGKCIEYISQRPNYQL